jgi:hypothetical protein
MTRLRFLLRVLTLCCGSATACDGALARSHGSDLLPLRFPFAHRPAVPFVASPALWKVFTGLAQTTCPPRNKRSLCPAFRRLSFGRSRSRGTARAVRSVLDAVATGYPLGNCDSIRLETRRTYLTQLRAVSQSPLVAESLLRVADGARTPPEELVNPASALEPCDPTLEGPSQPA